MRKYEKIIIGIAIFNFLIRIPFLNLPVHGDEIGYFDGALKVFKNGLNPFIEFWSYKPPFLFELTAFLYSIFGPSRWMGRLIIAIFSSLAIFLTYKVGEKIFSSRTGFLAAILLFLNPLYLTQSSLFQLAAPLTALFLAVLYSYFSEKHISYLVFASLFVLAKEAAVLAVLSLVFFDFITNFKQFKRKELLRREIVLASPFILFIIWMLLNKKFLGWHLWPYNVSYFSFERPDPRPAFNTFFSVSFQEQLLWFIYGLPFFGLLFSIGFSSLRKKIFKKEFLYLFSLSVFFPLFFYLGAFLPRYSLFTYPGLFLSFAWVLNKIFFKRRKSLALIMIFVCAIFIFLPIYSVFFDPKIHGWTGERDMSYLRFVWLGKKVVGLVEEKFPGKKIVTSWPLESVFYDPFSGYVTSSIDVVVFKDCSQLDQLENDFLLIAPITESREIREMEGCARSRNLDLVGEIDIKEKFPYACLVEPIRIYQGGR